MWIKRLAAALTICCLLVSAGGAALGEETDTPIPEGERPAFVQRLLDVAASRAAGEPVWWKD